MSSTILATGVTPIPPGTPQPAGGASLSSGSVAEVPAGAAQIRYISPVVQLDPEAGLAVLRVRDTENGDVRMQIPAERVVREYRSNQGAESTPERAVDRPNTPEPVGTAPSEAGKTAEVPAAA